MYAGFLMLPFIFVLLSTTVPFSIIASSITHPDFMCALEKIMQLLTIASFSIIIFDVKKELVAEFL